MNRASIFTGFSLSLILATQALAGMLDIPGNYGNAPGCKSVSTNDGLAEDLLLLTPDHVTTYATLCSFLQVLPAGEINRVATVICGHEGEETQTLGLMRFEKAPEGEDAWTIFDQNGESWGKVTRCP